jgi:hypothetical protein
LPVVWVREEGAPLPVFLVVLELDRAALSLLLSMPSALPGIPGWEVGLVGVWRHPEYGVRGELCLLWVEVEWFRGTGDLLVVLVE